MKWLELVTYIRDIVTPSHALRWVVELEFDLIVADTELHFLFPHVDQCSTSGEKRSSQNNWDVSIFLHIEHDEVHGKGKLANFEKYIFEYIAPCQNPRFQWKME